MSLSGDSTRGPDEKIKDGETQHDQAGIAGHLSGPVLDINHLGAEGQGLQTAHDGKTILIPQPSSDPHDPLNWTPLKKHITLLVITVVAFLPDFGSSMGIVALLPQAMYVALREHFEKLADELYIVSGRSLRTPFNITWLATCSAWAREDCLPFFCPPILADCQYSSSSHLWPWARPPGARPPRASTLTLQRAF